MLSITGMPKQKKYAHIAGAGIVDELYNKRDFIGDTKNTLTRKKKQFFKKSSLIDPMIQGQ